MIEQQFIEYVVKNLVDNPDEVKVARKEDDRGVLLELTVAPEDLGRVIGRRGVVAQSLRNILRALGLKNDTRYNLKIIDTDNGDLSNPTHDIDKSVNDVEKNNPDPVENLEARTEKLRRDIAELSDLDI